jgi:hypothetical protein
MSNSSASPEQSLVRIAERFVVAAKDAGVGIGLPPIPTPRTPAAAASAREADQTDGSRPEAASKVGPDRTGRGTCHEGACSTVQAAGGADSMRLRPNL